MKKASTSLISLSNNNVRFFLLLLVLAISIFNIFHRLNSNAIEEWDEARRGISAYEMLQNHEYIVNTFDGSIDYWSLKPPLGLWMIVGSYKLFGFNTFALRFPAALSALLCILTVMFLARRHFCHVTAILSGLVLATLYPFILQHSARAGEYDAPLTLMLCLAVLAMEILRNRYVLVIVLGLLIACSFLIKSFAAIFIIVVVVLGLFLYRKQINLNAKAILLLLLASIIPIALWAVMRFSHDGVEFFSRMIGNDLFRRTTQSIEGHKHSIVFYWVKLVERNWYWLLAAITLVVPLRNNLSWGLIERHGLFLTWFFVPLLIATAMATKIEWYINPSYPALAILIGSIFAAGFDKFRSLTVWILVITVIIAESQIIYRIHRRERIPADQKLLLTLKQEPAVVMYAKQWTQSQRFIVRVVKGMQIRSLSNSFGTSGLDKLPIKIFLEKKDLGRFKPDYSVVTENEQFAMMEKSSL